MRRVIRRCLLLVAWIVLGTFGGLVLAVGLPNAFHAKSLTVMSGSMEPTIGTGDVVVARQTSPMPPAPMRETSSKRENRMPTEGGNGVPLGVGGSGSARDYAPLRARVKTAAGRLRVERFDRVLVALVDRAAATQAAQFIPMSAVHARPAPIASTPPT